MSSKVLTLRIKQAATKLKSQEAAVKETKERIAKLKKDLADAKTTEVKPVKKAAKKAAKKATKKVAKQAVKKAAKKVAAPKAPKKVAKKAAKKSTKKGAKRGPKAKA